MQSISLKLNTHYVHDSRLGPHRLGDEELAGLASRVRDILGEIESERKAGRHRFRELPRERPQIAEIKALAGELRGEAENLLVLGNIALQSALNPLTWNLLHRSARNAPRLFVLDNIDPVYFESVMRMVQDDWSRTIVNVISKSGETAETSAQFLIVRDRMIQALGEEETARRVIVTTDPEKGTMRGLIDSERRRLGQETAYRSLAVPDGVGGRFSVLSAVGLFSAAMCNIDIDALLDGAAAMDAAVSDLDPMTNPAARLAMIHHLYMERGKPLHVMMPYSQQLKDLADWYRQLWAESLGKIRPADNRNVGPTPIKALGATDQHSQVQLYREGPNDKVFTFLEVDEFEVDSVIPQAFDGVEAMSYLGRSTDGTLGGLLAAEKRATELAMLVSRRPSLTIKFPQVNARTAGEFIYLWESVVPIMGKLMGIDPYDQPAVELGKKLTFHFMGRVGHEKLPPEME